MCPWVGPHAPSFGRQLWGLPSRVEYLSPQGVLLPLVYGTTTSPLWLELRGHSAWQATPSWTVYRLACHRLLPWLWVTFAMVPDAAWPGSDQWPWSTAPATGPVGRLGRPNASHPWGVGSFLSLCRPTCVQCPGPLGSCSPVCPRGLLCCVCVVLGHLAPVHRCARWVCCVACAVSRATWLLFTGAPARCVALHVRCPGPLGSCSPVCPLGVLFCVCGVLGHLLPIHRPLGVLFCVSGVLGHLAPVHGCARSVCCVACAVSWATWLLFTGAPARCVALLVWCPGPLGFLFTGVPAPWVVLRVQCPGPLGSCSPVCPLGVWCCACGVLGHLAPVHWCARLVCCSVCGVLGHLAPVHRCACSVCCFACVVSWATWLPVHRCARSVGCVACAVSRATWLLFTGVPARRVVLCMRCPGPPGSCSPVCPLGALCCVSGVLGHWAPVHLCARSVCSFACAASWAPWLLFTGVPTPCVVLRVRFPEPRGSCSPVCPLGVLCGVSGVLGHLAPVHRCVRSVCCFACAVSWATWLLFTGVPARRVVLRVRCPGPPGSCSPVCPLGALCCVCGVLGHWAPVHLCALSVCCFACAVSWAPWLLFTGVPTPCVVLRVRCPGPRGSCSPVCPLGVLCGVSGVLGHLAPVHRCVRSVCCFASAVSWATWLLFTGVPARRVVLRVRCPGPPGSCSPVCPLGALCCVCGVLGHWAPVHLCALSVCCFACAVSWAPWLLFTGVPTPCVVLRVRCPGPRGSCSPVCPLGVLCGVCGFLGHLAPVHRCARSVLCFARAVSWATWLPLTGVPARCVVLRVRCPGPPGSCSPVCPLGVLCCVYGVLGHLPPFTGVPAPSFALPVRCPAPLGSCSPVCPLGVLFCVCGVMGHLAPVHRCARSVCCVACAVSWATWLLFTGAPAGWVVLRL